MTLPRAFLDASNVIAYVIKQDANKNRLINIRLARHFRDDSKRWIDPTLLENNIDIL